MRLNKFISNSGYTSRRKADELIFNGRVMVNDVKVTEPSYQVKKDDKVSVCGKKLLIEDKVCFLLNKPYGYMSSLSDPNYDKFVTDLIETDKRIYPVGRLDVDSKGLLLLTNDGDLTNKLTHPSFEVAKTYLVEAKKALSEEDIAILEKGVHIDSKGPVKGIVKDLGEGNYLLTIWEGRNRQVRKMFKAVKNKVLNLTRISLGPIELGDLKSGKYRKLTKKEIQMLKEL